MRRATASLRFDLLDRLGMVAEATGVPVENVIDSAALRFLDGVSDGLSAEDEQRSAAPPPAPEEHSEGVWLPAEASSMLLRNADPADPTLFRLHHAGAWDAGREGDRSGVYYEDEERPSGAWSLYYLDVFVPTEGGEKGWLPAQPLGFQDETLDTRKPRLRQLQRAIIGAVDGWRGQRRDWRSSSSW